MMRTIYYPLGRISMIGKIKLPHMGNGGTRFQGRMRGQ